MEAEFNSSDIEFPENPSPKNRRQTKAGAAFIRDLIENAEEILLETQRTENRLTAEMAEKHNAEQADSCERGSVEDTKQIMTRSRAKTIARRTQLTETEPSTAPPLPPEIWLNIADMLDYASLHTCRMVNRHLNTLTKHPTLDCVLFRGKVLPQDAVLVNSQTTIDPTLGMMNSFSNNVEVLPHGTVLGNTRVRANPAFDIFQPVSYDIEGVMAYDYGGSQRTWPVAATCAASEHATHPPLSVLRIRVLDFKPVTVKYKRGVTVPQVFKGLCRIFGQKHYGVLDAWLAFAEGLSDGLDSEEPKGRALKKQWYTNLNTMHRMGWVGFEHQFADTDGVLVLHACYFDS